MRKWRRKGPRHSLRVQQLSYRTNSMPRTCTELVVAVRLIID